MESLSFSNGDDPPRGAGRFAEVSARHLSGKTARLLDLWAGPLAHEAPVLVAVNVKGWFVATLPFAPHEAPRLPDELRVALCVGRRCGFAYLFFHCDAPAMGGLILHGW